MRNQLKIVFSALAALATLGLTSTVHGIPAYARQTGLECGSCHASPGFPALNTFGQAFKAGGYTDGNEDNFMGDGEVLSIPKALNLSLVVKLNDEFVSSATGASENVINAPDEIALISGGKIATNVGYFAEVAGGGPGGSIIGNFKIVFAPQLGPVRLGIVPFYGGLGPAFAFENLSTANVENIRITEMKEYSSAQEAVDWSADASSAGLGIYVWHPFGFIAYVPYVTTEDPSGAGIANNIISNDAIRNYIRVAVTPSFGGMDLAVGFSYKTGAIAEPNLTAQAAAGSPVTAHSVGSNYMAIDAQFMGTLGIPLTLVVTYASDTPNGGTPTSAFAVAVDAQVIEKLNIVLGYRADLTPGNTGTLSNFGGAIKFSLARNLRISVDVNKNLGTNTANGEGDLTVFPMIFAGF